MKICFITPEFATEEYFSGGLSQVVYRKAKWLLQQGHDVHIILHSNRVGDIKKEGIWVHPIRVDESSPFFIAFQLLTLRRLDGSFYWLCFSVKVWLALKNLHKRFAFDVIDSSNYKACGFFAMLFLKGPVHIMFGASYRPLWNQNIGLSRNVDTRILEWLEAVYYRFSKNVYSPSEYLKNVLTEKLGLKNIEVIKIPFYLEVLNLDRSLYNSLFKGKPYLLFFGRLQSHKGPHILAGALPGFFSKFPDAYAVFIGPDTVINHGRSMREYIIQKNEVFKDRLIFLDQVGHNRLYPVISGARMVVLPSLVDNLPNALLEAMGLGKTVIGTYASSFDEVIEDGVNGFLVPGGDILTLQEKLIAVWKREDLDTIGKAARKKMDELAPQKVMNALLDYYRRART